MDGSVSSLLHRAVRTSDIPSLVPAPLSRAPPTRAFRQNTRLGARAREPGVRQLGPQIRLSCEQLREDRRVEPVSQGRLHGAA